MLSDLNQITLPNPIDELSTNRLLTMTRIDGSKIMDFIAKNSDIKIRNQVALNMFKAWYIPFYKYGVIHGDPHPGNYQVDNTNKQPALNLLDFGFSFSELLGSSSLNLDKSIVSPVDFNPDNFL